MCSKYKSEDKPPAFLRRRQIGGYFLVRNAEVAYLQRDQSKVHFGSLVRKETSQASS
jgi:hypothetical protein